MRRAFSASCLLLVATTATAQRPLVLSPGPDAVSVTIYRNPERSAGQPISPDWLGGFALITETRILRLPAGESEIRFEGVAGGIEPASAIVTGLPDGVGEKNRDARLLSPGALVGASLGRRVHLRRTDRATGRVRETEAVIRSGPDGIVLQTPAGFEALSCAGFPEALIYDRVPPGLSAKPTLAVTTRSAAAETVTIRLAYLADNFDWQADYIASIAPDGKTLDLFAWLTLANGNGETFAAAQTQAVAGRLNREDDGAADEPEPVLPEINLECWPRGTTSDIPLRTPYPTGSEGIVVTGARFRRANLTSPTPITTISADEISAQMEALGDLKLYRIPEPVTVAANGQKQIALLHRERVPFEHLYGASLDASGELKPASASILVRMRNLAARGLGLPLPTGNVVLFEESGGHRIMVGEDSISDKAVGEKVELVVGQSPQVQIAQRLAGAAAKGGSTRRREVEISNANSSPVEVELRLRVNGDGRLIGPSRKLVRDGSEWIWLARVPAHGRSILSYAMRPDPPQHLLARTGGKIDLQNSMRAAG